jgi:large subunit ribosomal protein L5
MKDNAMKEIRVAKITLNMSTGAPGPDLEKSKKLLEIISGRKVVKTSTHKRNTFGVAKGREIGVMTTLRGKGARELLVRLFKAMENKLKTSQFDDNGNFSIGIEEYISIPGVSYDPEIGIKGLDIAVTLERPGYRVARRSNARTAVGKAHRIKAEDAIEWVQREFGVEVTTPQTGSS